MPRSPTSISNHVEALCWIAVPLVGGRPWIGGGEGYTNSCETRARPDCRLIQLQLRLLKWKWQMRMAMALATATITRRVDHAKVQTFGPA